MDGAGNALVGWIRGNGIWTAAQIATRPTGGTFGPPRNLSRRGRNAGSIELAMNRRGDAMIAWLQGAGLVTSFRPAGEEGWRRARVTGYWYALRAKIALDETGNATAVFSGSYAGLGVVQAPGRGVAGRLPALGLPHRRLVGDP